MGYYIRILGIIDPNILISEIAAAIEKEGLKAKLSFLEIENLIVGRFFKYRIITGILNRFIDPGGSI